MRFVDWTQAGQGKFCKLKWTTLTQDDGSYLKKWDEFGDMEGELHLDKRAKLALQFEGMTQRRDGTVTVLISQHLIRHGLRWGKGAVP